MKQTLPRWWKAWQRLAPRWLRDPRSPHSQQGLLYILNELENDGCPVDPLRDWKPSKSQIAALEMALVEMGKLLNPHYKSIAKSLQRIRDKFREVAIPQIVFEMFVVNVAGRGKRIASLPEVVNQFRGEAKAERPKPSRNTTRSRQARQRLERARLEMPSATNWGRNASSFNVYIDETWPGTRKRNAEGVIAGIVWEGDQPDFEVLPRAKDHRYASLQAYQILEDLFRCPRALPFIMPIRLDDRHGAASQHYDDLLQACIQILLGWLLPVDGVPAAVRIWMDHDSQHPHGFDQTDFYQGLLRGASRYARWQIEQVSWYDLEQVDSYLAYADQLAYLARESTPANRDLGQIANFKELPGYVPLSMDLVQRLQRLEHLEENGDVANFLELASQLHDTRIGQLLIDDVRRRLAGRHDLQLQLLETLDRRFQMRNLDLRKLERAIHVAQRTISLTPQEQGIRARLLAIAVHFQRSNYDGDPERVTDVVQEYESLRVKALEDVPELVLECDLHLAGIFADRLEYLQALAITSEWINDRRFPYLSRFQRAKVLTARGQFLAIVADHDAAEQTLRYAVELIEAAELALPSLQGWRELPAGYRAHNAIDAGSGNGWQLLVDAIGDPESFLHRVLQNEDPKHDRYRHRLLLRAMAALGRNAPLSGLMQAYVQASASWTMGEGEPWAEIALYRAYLLWKVREPQQASRWFERALLSLHQMDGATMRLLVASIGTIAYCCFDDQHFHDAALTACEQVAPILPAPRSTIENLQAILRRPDLARVDGLMRSLKFHYH